ncbi:MAG: DUF58 domain-containing protein [Lachnospiraceae bacterium]|jgi:uncharacterized protein (DUF58 family)|nr:DUF58 domain-containing protein [Lachnospiraceae bacterium]
MKKIRNLIRYIIVIILDIFMMIVFHSYLNFILLVGLLLFPLYSIIGVYQARSHAGISISAPLEPMVRGEEFLVNINVLNDSFFPLVNVNVNLIVSNSFYNFKGEHTLNIPFRAKHKTKIEYPITMENCGRFYCEVTSLSFVDVLGVLELEKKVDASTQCLVIPTSNDLNAEAGQIYFKGVSEAVESKDKGFDFSDISGIREYIPGDKLQNIHWKLSAKGEDLMVKERVNVSAMQLNILLSLANDEEMCVEGALELADGIMKAFVKQNMPFTVYYYSVNRGELAAEHIVNDIERKQLIEMLLYDVCHDATIDVEDMFVAKHQGQANYLYIGQNDGGADDGNSIVGQKNTVAVLKRSGMA